MKKQLTLALLLAGIGLTFPALAQQRSAPIEGLPLTGKVLGKELPADLPQSKLLFVKFVPVQLAAEAPGGFGAERRNYFMKLNHNKYLPEANKQLVAAAAHYPYAYRITTPDSVLFYRAQGYQYMLMQSAFNAYLDGSFRGTTSHSGTYNVTSVGLYVQELNTGDKYFFDSFSESFVYAYQKQVEALLKRISKQFAANK